MARSPKSADPEGITGIYLDHIERVHGRTKMLSRPASAPLGSSSAMFRARYAILGGTALI